MAKVLATELPASLWRLLSGNDLATQRGVAFPLITVDPQGWPHVALLSYGDLVALDQRHLRLALWKDSTTSANLRRSGKLTIALVHRGASYYLKGTATEEENPMVGFPNHARFAVTIQQVLRDYVAADEPGVTLRPMTFSVHKGQEVLLERVQALHRALRQ